MPKSRRPSQKPRQPAGASTPQEAQLPTPQPAEPPPKPSDHGAADTLPPDPALARTTEQPTPETDHLPSAAPPQSPASAPPDNAAAEAACSAVRAGKSLLAGPPLALALKPRHWTSHCHGCLRRCPQQLKRCSACIGAHYCSIQCQKHDWLALHRLECKAIKRFQRDIDKVSCKTVDSLRKVQEQLSKDMENEALPKLLSQRVNGENNAALALLIYRVFLLEQDGRLAGLRGAATGRGFGDLLSHEEHFRKSADKMLLFRVLSSFVCTEMLPGADAQAIYRHGADLFSVFCKVLINSHSLYHWDAEGECQQVALALCLDVSAYDHACAPTAELRSDGRCTAVLGLGPALDLADTRATFIPYVNLMAERTDRRAFLRANYFFDCLCALCQAPATDLWKTAMACKDCSRVVPTGLALGDAEQPAPASLSCEHCGALQPDGWTGKAVQTMRAIRDTLGCGVPGDEPPRGAPTPKLLALEAQAAKHLSKNNIYYGYLLEQLRTAPGVPARMRTKAWLGYYVILKCSHPQHSARMVLPNAIATARALCQGGDYKIAKQILHNTVQPLARFYFGDNPTDWPFRRLVDYLEICAREERLPAQIKDYI